MCNVDLQRSDIRSCCTPPCRVDFGDSMKLILLRSTFTFKEICSKI